MPYLAVDSFGAILAYLEQRFPTLCSSITLPEKSIERRTIQGLRIGKPAAQTKRTVLLFAGVHARELVNPDLLITFAAELLYAYSLNSDLNFGKVYSASLVQMLMSAIDIIVVPLVNPDGRAYVQAPGGDVWWRKNRNPNPGQTCMGVDINRNYDFLWSSGIGTSTNSCSEIYKGTAAFSEPETRNVRWLLDTYPEISGMVDVHSFSELILYPYGDDESQVTNPAMSFTNPAFNGQRGQGGDAYKEYIDSKDRELFVDVGYRIRDAIYIARGHCYTLQPNFDLYPTTGTSTDYAYSRHIVDATKTKIFSYCMETGVEFQPPPGEAMLVIKEACAGLFQFCLGMCCPILSGKQYPTNCGLQFNTIDLFAEPKLRKMPLIRRYEKFLLTHFMEMRELTQSNRQVYTSIVRLARYTDKIARLHFSDFPGVLDVKLITNIDRTLVSLSNQPELSLKFRQDLKLVRADLRHFKGRTFVSGLLAANRVKKSDKSKRKTK